MNHPRALPLAVPAATVHMAAQRGMDVVVLRPEGFALPDAVMERARLAAAASGGSVTDWCVSEPWFRAAQQDCHLMHCLPVRRNVAVADHVLDGRRSRVVAGAANRMTVQMAVLHRMLATN